MTYTLPITEVTHDWDLLESYRFAYREYLPKWLSDWATELASTPNSITATSTTSVSIGTGSKTFVLAEANRAFQVNQYVTCVDTASTTNWINGTVISYSGNNLTVTGVSSNGSGSKSSWKIYVSGPASGGGGGGSGSTTLAALTDVQTNFFTSAGNRISHVNAGSDELGHTEGFEFNGSDLSVPNNIAMQADNYVGPGNNDRLLFENSSIGGLWANSGSANITIDSADGGTASLFRVYANTNNLSAGSPSELLRLTETGVLSILPNTGAFIPNSLTTTERDALTGAPGMLIWNETTTQHEVYDGAAWSSLGGSGGGSSTFTGLSDVNASALSGKRIPYANSGGTEIIGNDNFRYDDATDVFYLGAFALDSAGELRIFNTAMSAYSSIKAANFLPGSDGNGIWRGSSDYYYPKNGSMHEFKSSHGFELLHGSSKVLSLTSNGAILANATSDPSSGDLTAGTNVWVVDETNNTAQAFFKYSNGSTFKKLSTALALVDA